MNSKATRYAKRLLPWASMALCVAVLSYTYKWGAAQALPLAAMLALIILVVPRRKGPMPRWLIAAWVVLAAAWVVLLRVL